MIANTLIAKLNFMQSAAKRRLATLRVSVNPTTHNFFYVLAVKRKYVGDDYSAIGVVSMIKHTM